MLQIQSNMIEAHIFRIKKGQIEFLLLKRAETEIYPGLWQMVSGRIHEGEKAYETAMREIMEETNLHPLQFWVVPNINAFYSFEENHISLLAVFAARVSDNAKVTISHEHSDFKWVRKEKAKKMLAWAGQRKSVEIITEYFTKEKSTLNFTEIKLDEIVKFHKQKPVMQNKPPRHLK